MTGFAICFIDRGGMTAAAISHSAKAVLFWMLIPWMPATITSAIPRVYRVTIETVRAKSRAMPSRVAMTGNTGGGRPRKLTVLMAGDAVHANMPARQRKIRLVMIEWRIRPTSCLVARAAFERETSGVGVILLMTISARAHCPHLWRSLVTLLAIHIGVLTIQFEGGLVVVKRGGRPRVHAVTRQTVRAEATFVRFVLPMAGETVSRRGLQIRQRTRRGMAGVTIHIHMRAGQCKGDLAMIEVLVIGIHAVMTGEAVAAPGSQVSVGEVGIHPAMTIHTNLGIEIG